MEAGSNYERFGHNYFTLRENQGVMMFTRRIIFEHEIAVLAAALFNLFSYAYPVRFTVDTARNAADSIRREMSRHFPNMRDRPNEPLPNTSLFISGASNMCITVDGYVSCRAATNYANYDDYLTPRHCNGKMIFSRRVEFEHEIAPLLNALLTLFYCEMLVLYSLD